MVGFVFVVCFHSPPTWRQKCFGGLPFGEVNPLLKIEAMFRARRSAVETPG